MSDMINVHSTELINNNCCCEETGLVSQQNTVKGETENIAVPVNQRDIYKKCPHKRIMKAKIPAKSVSKENKATQLNKTKEVENNIFPDCLAF